MSNDFSKELLEQASEKLLNISKGAEISADDMKFILTHEAMHREFSNNPRLRSRRSLAENPISLFNFGQLPSLSRIGIQNSLWVMVIQPFIDSFSTGNQ